MTIDERVERLEGLMERLINVSLSTQEQVGFLAAILRDTRKDVTGISDRIQHLEQGQQTLEAGQSELNRKLDLVLQRLTGFGGQP
jgi:hypothetical protein